MRSLQLTLSAQTDLDRLFQETATQFGTSALARYRKSVVVALIDLLEDATCPGSLARSEFGPRVRSCRLQCCRRRAKLGAAMVGRPRHLIAYEADDIRLLVPAGAPRRYGGHTPSPDLGRILSKVRASPRPHR